MTNDAAVQTMPSNQKHLVDHFKQQPIHYIPSEQRLRILVADVIKPNGDIQRYTSKKKHNPLGKENGVYKDYAQMILSFDQLEAGDLLHIQYQLEDTLKENLFGEIPV